MSRSNAFQLWLMEQPPSVTAQIKKAEREYERSMMYRAPFIQFEDSMEGYVDRDGHHGRHSGMETLTVEEI
jgi:hypothetical protein